MNAYILYIYTRQTSNKGDIMSLLSRYYVKARIQEQLINNVAEEHYRDGADDIFREVAQIKELIVNAKEETSKAVHGFFETAGYSY